MKIQVTLTGDLTLNQLKELIEKLSSITSVEVDASEEENHSDDSSPIISFDEWPDPKDSEPACNLLRCLSMSRDDGGITPSDLKKLSYQRALRLARNDSQRKRHGIELRRLDKRLHRNMKEVEEVLGIKFVSYDKPTDELINIYRETLPDNYSKKKLANDIHLMKTLMRPRKMVADLDTEFKSHNLSYVLYTHGIYTATDLKTLDVQELEKEPILQKMYEMVWLN